MYQVIAIGLVAAGAWWLASNTLHNMQVRGIQSGFDFLGQPAGFDIGELMIPYESVDPYWKAFLVGVLNTLRVAIIGIVLTTLLGTLIGVGRFSNNAIVRGLCYAYVELFRNVPVLLHLLMWYLVLTSSLPGPGEARSVGGLIDNALDAIERDNVTVLMGEINSGSALTISQVAARNKKLFMSIGARSDALRGKDCNRYTFHVDIPVTVMVNAVGQSLVRDDMVRGKKFFSLTADYLFGHDLAKAAKRFFAANGGNLIGDELVPTDVADFSPYLLKIRQVVEKL